jgi:hypothetical protein
MALRHLREMERDAACRNEMPIALLASLYANANRDTKRRTKPYTHSDFSFFAREERPNDYLDPGAVAVAFALENEGLTPPLLLAVWDKIVKREPGPMPDQRALKSDCGRLWILAPKWEGAACRGGLVLMKGKPEQTMRVRDIDKPMLYYDLKIPQRKGFGWIEGGQILHPAEN